jgi:hypothetical protein
MKSNQFQADKTGFHIFFRYNSSDRPILLVGLVRLWDLANLPLRICLGKMSIINFKFSSFCQIFEALILAICLIRVY